MQIKEKFGGVYKKVKLNFIRHMFKRLNKDKDLSSSEYFCMECIYLMDSPTISQFANFLNISSPNATYKVKTLIKKGYLQKEKSQKDKREYRLVPTQKFLDVFETKEDDLQLSEVKKGLSSSDSKKVEKIVKILSERS